MKYTRTLPALQFYTYACKTQSLGYMRKSSVALIPSKTPLPSLRFVEKYLFTSRRLNKAILIFPLHKRCKLTIDGLLLSLPLPSFFML